MINPVIRKIEFYIFVLTLAVLSASFYFQYYRGMEPCPLCIMQRICFLLLLITTTTSLCLRSMKYMKLILGIQLFIILLGFYFSGRQVWLQLSTPAEGAVCLPELDVLLQYFPWKDIFHALFWGTGGCAEVSWKLLGLSMQMWSLIYFSLIAIASGILWRRL